MSSTLKTTRSFKLSSIYSHVTKNKVSVIALKLFGIMILVGTFGYGTIHSWTKNENSQISAPTTSHHRLLEMSSENNNNKPRGIAWFLTFPYSGTVYTTILVRSVSRASTATNYGTELVSEIDLARDLQFSYTASGPYRSSFRYPYPSDGYLLTKTHCTGHCGECSPDEYITSTDEFIRKCTYAPKYDSNALNTDLFYDPKIVKKVVHMLRNPFDNIVALFHGKYKVHNRRGMDNRWDYTYNKDGFKSWCRDMDTRYMSRKEALYPPDVFSAAKDVPCHAQIYQYVQWHNNAFAVSEMLNVPTLVMYYEDYHHHMDRSVENLLSFLNLPRMGKNVEFIWNGGYLDYYSDAERVAVTRFIGLLSSPQTCRSLKRYFGRGELAPCGALIK